MSRTLNELKKYCKDLGYDYLRFWPSNCLRDYAVSIRMKGDPFNISSAVNSGLFSGWASPVVPLRHLNGTLYTGIGIIPLDFTVEQECFTACFLGIFDLFCHKN